MSSELWEGGRQGGREGSREGGGGISNQDHKYELQQLVISPSSRTLIRVTHTMSRLYTTEPCTIQTRVLIVKELQLARIPA